MTKIPKISGDTMIKYVTKKGFIILRQKGSHVRLRKDSIFITIPAGNNTLKIGTLLGLLGEMLIDRDEFIRDYNNGLVK